MYTNDDTGMLEECRENRHLFKADDMRNINGLIGFTCWCHRLGCEFKKSYWLIADGYKKESLND